VGVAVGVVDAGIGVFHGVPDGTAARTFWLTGGTAAAVRVLVAAD